MSLAVKIIVCLDHHRKRW